MSEENLLMVADSDHDANMRYAVGMFVPDPFIFLRLNGSDSIVMNDLEIDRARRSAPHCEVLSLSFYLEELHKKRVKKPKLANVIAAIMRERKIKKIHVPANFPLSLARQLRDLDIKVKVKAGSFFPERESKTVEEVKKLSAALMMAEVGLAEGIQALKSAKIDKKGQVLRNGVALTSDKLRSIIDIAILQAGGLARHTIVAGGKQGCNPHEPGHGPLKANQPIILDVFPHSQKTGYFGDITRTVVKGRASEAVRQVYSTVAEGQQIAFKQIAAGRKGVDVHNAVNDFFKSKGYATGKKDGRMQGFFHGTGHGLGLEIHEPPRISLSSTDTLRVGHVVTVEPGLYYPEIGGVRLEDVAHISDKGTRNLTKFEKQLEV